MPSLPLEADRMLWKDAMSIFVANHGRGISPGGTVDIVCIGHHDHVMQNTQR